MKYYFEDIQNCNMCEAPIDEARVLGKRMNRSQGVRPKGKIGISTTVMQCQICDLIFSNPLPVPNNINQHYGIPPEDYWVPEEFEVTPNYFESQIRTFNKLYKKEGAKTALDIGAGLGKCMIALEKSGFDTFGIEPSEPFYTRALGKMGISEKKLKLASLEEAEYPSNQFDFITFGAVLEHLYDPSAAIKKALMWLKPGGLIQIVVPSSAWLTSKIYNLIYRIQGLDYVGNISPMHPPFHLYEFGLKSFEMHSAKFNYEIAYHRYELCNTFLPKIFDPIIKPIMLKTNTGMELEIWLRKKIELK
jgi:ubiquinone/menaquinone biosynthesis C-methylase UbiE